jgi:hypothetical protein
VENKVNIAGKQIYIVVLIAIAIPLAVAGWWVERNIHWKLMYEGKVEQKIEGLARQVQDLTSRVQILEQARQTK